VLRGLGLGGCFLVRLVALPSLRFTLSSWPLVLRFRCLALVSRSSIPCLCLSVFVSWPFLDFVSVYLHCPCAGRHSLSLRPQKVSKESGSHRQPVGVRLSAEPGMVRDESVSRTTHPGDKAVIHPTPHDVRRGSVCNGIRDLRLSRRLSMCKNSPTPAASHDQTPSNFAAEAGCCRSLLVAEVCSLLGFARRWGLLAAGVCSPLELVTAGVCLQRGGAVMGAGGARSATLERMTALSLRVVVRETVSCRTAPGSVKRRTPTGWRCEPLSLLTFFAAAKKVSAAPHRGSANRPIRNQGKANAQRQTERQTERQADRQANQTKPPACKANPNQT
jgi:hypothetical protein